MHGRDEGGRGVGDVDEGDEAAEEDGGGQGVGLAGLEVRGDGDEREEGGDEDCRDFEGGEEGDSYGGIVSLVGGSVEEEKRGLRAAPGW